MSTKNVVCVHPSSKITNMGTEGQLKEILETALAIVVKGSSRRQGDLIKAAKEALASLKALTPASADEAVRLYPEGHNTTATAEPETPGPSENGISPDEKTEGEQRAAAVEESPVSLTLRAGEEGLVSASLVPREVDDASSAPASPEPAPKAPAPATADSTHQEYRTAIAVVCRALEVRQTKVVDSMLDVAYMLVTKGFVAGSASLASPKRGHGEPAAMAELGSNPCGSLLRSAAAAHEFGDEQCERKSLRVLLAMVLADTVGVHGEPLLLCVKTFYHVYLGSRQDATQLLAKACLTQTVLSAVGGMERPQEECQRVDVTEIAPQGQDRTTKQEEAEKLAQQQVDLVFADVAGLRGAAVGAECEEEEEEEGVEGEGAEGKGGQSRSLGTFAAEGERGRLPRGALTKRKDVYLVLRALCKLSMKGAGGDSGSDQLATKGKLLSLELVRCLLQCAGDVFVGHDRFNECIKQYLCLSLLKNASSILSPTYQLSASIFSVLVEKCRRTLKSQFSVFFPMIFLKPLESNQFQTTKGMITSYDLYSQWVVLFRCLYHLCCNKQVLSDIFVNYDCDLNESNLYERLVAGLVRVVQGGIPTEGSGFTSTMEFNLKFFALQCLVGVVKSLASDQDQGEAAEAGEDGDGGENAGEVEEHEGDGENEEGEPADDIESRKAQKARYQKGLTQFKRKPKKGVAFLQKHGFLGEGAKDVASFFLQGQDQLDKTSIGEYLGEADAFNLDVMYAYVEMLDFTDMKFDEGLRHFLGGFRLPGESQKIDRFMLKYAERYCICNPQNVFANTDAAYVFAYSVIMLQTDAHNDQVKNKMTVEEFKRNNRGINDEKDLPAEFVAEIYENVVNNEFKLKGNDEDVEAGDGGEGEGKQSRSGLPGLDAILNVFGGSQVKRNEPSEEVIRRKHEEMAAAEGEAKWQEAAGSEDVRPMLEAAWAPLLGAVSIAFEETDDESITSLCMDALYFVVKVAAPLDMDTVRDAFLTSLAKATHLHAINADMHRKRGEAFRTLLNVAMDCGNHLAEGWKTVLTTVSQYERACEGARGGAADEILGMPSPPPATPTRLERFKKSKAPSPAQVGASVRDAFGANTAATVVLVFESSGQLGSTAVVHFVRALCEVSSQELASKLAPRVYSLTKIVEVAHYNMNRVRIVWSRIWSILADFFIFVGCHPTLNVAMYAIDALRQLAMKFLERDELANYTFQNEFLKPFVLVMRQSKAVEIRELIIRCVSQFILARVANVKSGWKSMFMVFTAAAADENRQLVALAFSTIEKIVREYFSHVTETETSTFTDCVNCLIAFANSSLSDVSLNAIAFLRFCALKLAEGELGELEAPSPHQAEEANVGGSEREGRGAGPRDEAKIVRKASRSSAIVFTDQDVHLYFWFPLLAGLSELTFDTRQEIRHTSLGVLFDILDYHGSTFTIDFWVRIFNSILFPIFDQVRMECTEITTFVPEDQRPKADAWLYETSKNCLHKVIDLFVKFYGDLRPLLPNLVDFVCGFVRRNHENLAAMGVEALRRILGEIGTDAQPKELEYCLEGLRNALAETRPSLDPLLASLEDESVSDTSAGGVVGARRRAKSLTEGQGARRLAQVKCKIRTQVLLVRCLNSFLEDVGDQLPPESRLSVLDLLGGVMKRTKAVNTDIEQRARLMALMQANGDLDPRDVLPDPPLIELERTAFEALLGALKRAVGSQAKGGGGGEVGEKMADLLVSLCAGELETFLETSGKFGQEECAYRRGILHDSLSAVLDLPEALFRGNIVALFTKLSQLISCEHVTPEILKVTSRIFQERILDFIQA